VCPQRNILNEVIKGKQDRIEKTTGPHPVRVVPQIDDDKKEFPMKDWAY
jgi:hypothetical protein